MFLGLSLLRKLLGRLTCACTSSAEEHACTDQVTEVIPPARIGKGVDAVIREQAADKAKEDEKTMQESKKETRCIVSGRIWLSSTTCDNERQ